MTLNFYPRLYVGVQGKKQFNEDNPPLAFATQVGKDKAWEKRKKTVDDWAGYTNRGTYVWNEETRRSEYVPPPPQKEEGFYIDNEPMSGFYFEKSVTRWQTSNKWFAINDPRGFQLQISAENLGYILLNSHISKGMLVGKFLWAKDGANIYLCPEDHQEYKDYLAPPVAREKTKLKVGDLVIHSNDENKYIFAGKKYALLMRRVTHYRRIATGEIINETEFWERKRAVLGQWYSSTYSEREIEFNAQYEKVSTDYWQKDDKSYQLFVALTSQNTNKTLEYKVMRSNGKYKVLEEGLDIPKFNSNGHFINGSSYYIQAMKFFDSKKELEDYNPEDGVTLALTNSERNSYRKNQPEIPVVRLLMTSHINTYGI